MEREKIANRIDPFSACSTFSKLNLCAKNSSVRANLFRTKCNAEKTHAT